MRKKRPEDIQRSKSFLTHRIFYFHFGVEASNIIFIDVSDGIKSRSELTPLDFNYNFYYYSAARLSKVIHHELTHSMDDTMGYWWGPKWESLNSPSFQYGSYQDGSSPRRFGPNVPLTSFWNPIDGFVSEYATSNFAEIERILAVQFKDVIFRI